jgi:hypothetical protein
MLDDPVAKNRKTYYEPISKMVTHQNTLVVPMDFAFCAFTVFLADKRESRKTD